MMKPTDLMRELAAAGPSAIHSWTPERDDLYFDAQWLTGCGESLARIFCRSVQVPYYYAKNEGSAYTEESLLPDWHGVVDLPSYGYIPVMIGAPREVWEPDIDAAKAAGA
jgi:hypothetical protein